MLEWIDRHAPRLADESVALEDAAAASLAADVIAPLDVPGFDRAAMDGYALRGAETAGASEYNPLAFPVLGQAMPGQPFAGAVPADAAIRIMTGAPVPDGVDAVVPAEYAHGDGGTDRRSRGRSRPASTSDTAARTSAKASPALRAGRRLRRRMSVSSRRWAWRDVARRPAAARAHSRHRQRSEGTRHAEGPVSDLRRQFVHAARSRRARWRRARGARTGSATIRTQIRDALLAPGADVILVSGGSSVGQRGLRAAAARRGRRARRFTASRCGRRVPPASGASATRSCSCCPAIPCPVCAPTISSPAAPFACAADARRTGRIARGECIVARKIVSAIGRVDYCRVRLVDDRVEPIALSGASILSSTTRADGFVIVPAESEGYGPDTEVTVYLYD